MGHETIKEKVGYKKPKKKFKTAKRVAIRDVLKYNGIQNSESSADQDNQENYKEINCKEEAKEKNDSKEDHI